MNWYSAIWYWYSILIFCPFALMTLIRYWKKDPYDIWMGIPSYFIDTCFRVGLFPASFYYVTDSIYTVIQWERMNMCNLAYVLHHVITMSGSIETLTLPYYRWFVISPFAVHSLLIMFPYKTWLNYVYLGSILTMFYNLNQKPWSPQYRYRRVLHTAYLLVAIPIIMLWWYECKNDMQNVI